jgi:hypothetical protein
MSVEVTVRWARWTALCAVAAMLAACATAPVVRTRVAENVSLGSFHTFAFVRHPGTDRGRYKSITTQQLELDVGRELRARGYVPASAGQSSDLLVNFHIDTHDRVEGAMGPGYPYCGWGWGWGWGWGMGPCGWGGYYNDIRTVTTGALTVDLINRANRSVVWSGTAVGDLTNRIVDHPAQTIDQAVREIFRHFPVAPAR